MGCIHYERPAAIARIEKDELIIERREYTNFRNDLPELYGVMSNYSSFFRSLVPHLEEIIINHATFNSEECNSYANHFAVLSHKFTVLISDVNEAISDIDKEIKEKEAIIAKSSWTCASCYQKNKESEE